MKLISVKELLENDHREINDLFGRAMQALDGGRPSTAHNRLDLFWMRLAVHIRAEHKALFPRFEALRSRPDHPAAGRGKEFETTVQSLRREHDEFMLTLSESVATLKKVRRGADAKEVAAKISAVKDRLTGLSERLSRHNIEEESTVYPLIDAWESPASAEALHRQLTAELQRLPSRAGN